MSNENARKRYWARAVAGFQHVVRAEPNAAHMALSKLEHIGYSQHIVTQNVDR
jgi:NAD-dependent SIR2 family protein deacetylase